MEEYKKKFVDAGWEKGIPVRMLFCVADDDDEMSPGLIARMEIVREFEIPFAGSCDIEDYICDIFDKCNEQLSDVLAEKNIKHFIPIQKPSFRMQEKFELCYWFARSIYQKVYETTPDFCITPGEELLNQLNSLYKIYHLDGWDDQKARV